MGSQAKMSIRIPSTAKSAGEGDGVLGHSHSCSSKGQCLCSPTTHPGSFRCRLHRSNSLPWSRQSKSTAASADASNTSDLSPKSVESA
uniref:Serine-rich protein n=1 Tax=Cucumis sativus TaxID=3659 RepID=A0A0A0LWJ0_CUCSA